MARFVSSGVPVIGWYATASHWWGPAVAALFLFCVVMALNSLLVFVKPDAPRLTGLLCGCFSRCLRGAWRCLRCKKKEAAGYASYSDDGDDRLHRESRKDK